MKKKKYVIQGKKAKADFYVQIRDARTGKSKSVSISSELKLEDLLEKVLSEKIN